MKATIFRMTLVAVLALWLMPTFIMVAQADEIPPAAPTGLDAIEDDTQVWLDWNDNIEGDLAGYNVYRSTAIGGPYPYIGSTIVSDYNDTGLTNGITYYYVVTAFDTFSNESGYSNEVSATPHNPHYEYTPEEANVSPIGGDPAGDSFNLTIGVSFSPKPEYWVDTEMIMVSPDDPYTFSFNPQQFRLDESNSYTKIVEVTVLAPEGIPEDSRAVKAQTLNTSGPPSVGLGSGCTVTITVSAAELVSIAVTPVDPTISLGETQQFTATGTYSDSSTQDITTTASWSSTDTGVATIDAAGLATSVAAGTTGITAELDLITSPAQTLTITAAELVSIAVTPVDPTISLGETQQFTATGTYTDVSTHDITSTVTWDSSITAVATIDAAGLATSVAAGTTDITAELDLITSPAQTLTITAAELVSIAVTPVDPTISLGETQQFTATGTYTDVSTHDITSTVTWDSSITAVATIDAAGLATSVAAGTTSITAELDLITSPAQTLTITAAELVSIAVTPVDPTISLGETQQFTATGTYTDASTHDITSTVTWDSSITAVATIDAAGLATSVAAGTTGITTELDLITSPAQTLTITAAELVSIAVTPVDPTISLGETQQFTATGTYIDASTHDITSTVTWDSSITAVATIDAAGLATSVAAGTTDITAELDLITSPAQTLTVSAAIPDPPINLTATAVSSSQIDLSWNDNSDNEDGFNIERSDTGAEGTFNQIDTVGANVETYSDTGLGSTYYYQVEAYNSAGDSSYSNVASATTPSPGGAPHASACFIATAAYGTPMAEEIGVLREFRDQYMLTNPVGEALVDLYYETSPPIAEFIDDHPALKPIVRAALLPAVAMSEVAISTTLAEKAAIVGSLALVSIVLTVWLSRRRGRGSQYS